MKCPKCNYTSFDNLTSCRKCGFVFKNSGGSEPLSSFESIRSGTEAEGEEIARGEKPSNISKTVASIQASLDEIEAGEPEDTGSSPPEQTSKIEGNVPQPQKDDTPVEGSKKFPAFNEINWEESVSLSSDELNLDIADVAGDKGEEKREIRFEDEELKASDIKTEKLKEELERMGEELRQIEEKPEKSETLYLSEHSAASFDLTTVRKGGFWIRFIASIIDNVVLYVINFILIFVGIIAMGLGPSGLEGLEGGGVEKIKLLLPFYLCSIIITIAYYTYFHGNTGQTPGKMMCKLKVVRTNGESLGYGKAFLRWIGYIVSWCVFGLGYLWVAWDKRKQAWHDKIAGTCVIRI